MVEKGFGVVAVEEEVVADVGGGLDDCRGGEREEGDGMASTNNVGGGTAK